MEVVMVGMSSAGETGTEDLAREELLLKLKATMLDDFLMNNNPGASVSERCRILRHRIVVAEDELSRHGLLPAAESYLATARRPEFDLIDRGDFSSWLEMNRSWQIDTARTVPTERSDTDVTSSTRERSYPYPEDVIAASSFSHRPKRVRTTENEKPPCLRCKILKKRCDSLDKCSLCPQQGFDNDSDYWKVLGCFRDKLQELSSIFCPDFSRSTTRVVRHRKGDTETISFVLTKSRVSIQKKRRIAHLVRTRIDFAQLDDASWEDVSQRESVSRSATVFADFEEDNDLFDNGKMSLEDYEAAWSVLQAVSMDARYLARTEYNLFTLIRCGNKHSKSEPLAWSLFEQAKLLLRQAVEVYLLERLCAHMASEDKVTPQTSDPTSEPSSLKTLVLVDVKEDVEIFLKKFEKTCSGRAKLTAHLQLGCFYALLLFGVAKSMLIDAYSLRSEYEDVNPWVHSEAVKITSAYKALVSVFAWSSKSDLILQSEQVTETVDIYTDLQDAQVLVHKGQWEERGFKGTKDFLLSIGSCFFPNGTYNGFLPQKFGLDAVERASLKVAAIDVGRGSTILEQVQSHVFPSTNDDRNPQKIVQYSSYGLSPTPVLSPISIASKISGPLDEYRLPPAPSQEYDINDWASSNTEFSSGSGSTQGTFSTFTFIEHGEKENSKTPKYRQGARRGPLSVEARNKARSVRTMGACLPCRLMKVPCSEESPCNRCRRQTSVLSSPPSQLCLRTSLTEYIGTLFPVFLTAQFSRHAVENYFEENTNGFTDQRRELQINWGGEGSMAILANTFKTTPNFQGQMTYREPGGQIFSVDLLPVGVLDFHPSELEKDFLRVLRTDLETFGTKFSGGARTLPTSRTLSRVVLEAVFSFFSQLQPVNPLVRDLLLLYLGLCHASRPIVFTESSATSSFFLYVAEDDGAKIYSSRLLNRQLEHIMYRVVVQLAKTALKELEKLILRRDKSLWSISFAALLLLFLSLEQIEVLAYAHVENQRAQGSESITGLDDQPRKFCQTLEDGPFAQLTHVFHLLYRTNKASPGGLNPLREDFKNEGSDPLDSNAMEMVKKIRRDESDNYFETMQEWTGPPRFDDAPEEFAKRNSGRLIARFLLSFKVPET